MKNIILTDCGAMPLNNIFVDLREKIKCFNTWYMTPFMKYFLYIHKKCKTQHTATTLNHSDAEQSAQAEPFAAGLSGTL